MGRIRRLFSILIALFVLNFYCIIDTSTAQVIYDENVITSPEIETIFQEGIHYFKSKDYQNAERVFAKLIAYSPPHQRITISHLMYGKILFALGEYKQAILHLREFNQIYPESRYVENSHYTLGSAYYMLGNYLAAVREFLWMVDFAKVPKLASNSKIIANHLIEYNLSIADIETLIAEIPSKNAIGILTIKLAKKQAQKGFSNTAINIIIDYMNNYPQSEYTPKLEKLISKAKLRSYSTNSIKIGVILPLSGGYSEDGEHILQGIKYALKKSRSDLAVQLDIRDSESNIITAIKAAQDLVTDESILAIIGELESSVTAAISTVISSHKIPLIAPVASQFGIASIGENVFQANCDLIERGKRLATHAMKELGLKTFATLAPVDEYGRGMTDGFTSMIDELGGTIIAQKWFYEGTTDQFKRQIRSIRSLGFKKMEEDSIWNQSKAILLARAAYDTSLIPITSIDALFCPVYTDDIKYIGPQCAAFNIQTQLLGGDYWHDLEILRSSQSYVNGVVFTSDYYVDEYDPAFRRFRTDFRREMKSDFGRFQAYGHDAMKVILHVLEGGNVSTRSHLRDELELIYRFEGLKGLISWRGNERINSEINILEFSNGSIKKVE